MTKYVPMGGPIAIVWTDGNVCDLYTGHVNYVDLQTVEIRDKRGEFHTIQRSEIFETKRITADQLL